jgi:ankyrin repeat protein
MHAIDQDNPESVKTLLANVKNPEQLICMKDLNGWTALMHAADRHDYVSIKVLLEGVSDPEQLIFMTNDDNKTATTLAMDKQYRHEFFEDESESYDDEELEHIHQVHIVQLESIKALLSGVTNKDALICRQDAGGNSMLMHALRLDNAELVKFLLSSVNNPEAVISTNDSKGMNLLMRASSSAKAKSIEVILSVGKNPEAFAMNRDSKGMTALMHAIGQHHPISIKAILSNVNNPDKLALMKDKHGNTALMQLAAYGYSKPVTALLDYVKNPIELIYSSMPDGTTPLMLFIKNLRIVDIDSNPITKILEKLKKVRDPNFRFSPKYRKGKNAYISLPPDSLIFMKDSKGMNAFMFAVQRIGTLAASTLLISTTDKLELFTAKNNDQLTALDLLHPEYGEEMCDALIERVEQLQISNNSQDLDTVMWLLRDRKARFH